MGSYDVESNIYYRYMFPQFALVSPVTKIIALVPSTRD